MIDHLTPGFTWHLASPGTWLHLTPGYWLDHLDVWLLAVAPDTWLVVSTWELAVGQVRVDEQVGRRCAEAAPRGL